MAQIQNVIKIITVILNNFFCNREKTKSLIVHSYAFRKKPTAMFGSDNGSQRLIQGYQNLCLEFSIRFPTFSGHNKRYFLRLHRWVIREVWIDFLATGHNLPYISLLREKKSSNTTWLFPMCFLFIISISIFSWPFYNKLEKAGHDNYIKKNFIHDLRLRQIYWKQKVIGDVFSAWPL